MAHWPSLPGRKIDHATRFPAWFAITRALPASVSHRSERRQGIAPLRDAMLKAAKR
jgi:hypothetical protein